MLFVAELLFQGLDDVVVNVVEPARHKELQKE